MYPLKSRAKLQQTTLLFIFLTFFFFKEIRLDFSCESSARQRIHRKNQALFSLKIMKTYSRLSSAAVVTVAVRVKTNVSCIPSEK